jgi:hypothetical protein
MLCAPGPEHVMVCLSLHFEQIVITFVTFALVFVALITIPGT